MLHLTLYEKAGKKSLIVYIGIGAFSILGLYLLMPGSNPLFFILPFIIFLIIITVAEPKAKAVGTIGLSERHIVIKTDRREMISELSGISKLTLKYSGYKGKRLAADFFPRFNQYSGIDNYISFSNGPEVVEYRFLVEDETQEEQIIELVSGWERLGVDVSRVSLNI